MGRSGRLRDIPTGMTVVTGSSSGQWAFSAPQVN